MRTEQKEEVEFEVERYSATESAVLEALATYRYMTAEQMVRIGVAKALTHLRTVLRKLQKKRPALVAGLDFGVLPIEGKLPRMHWLTPYGAEVLEEMHGNGVSIDVPKKVRLFRHDYAHRRATVDTGVPLHCSFGRTIGKTGEGADQRFPSCGHYLRTRGWL